MGFVTDIVQSKGYKAFMSKLYGIGASVVIIGALFKIQHWPFASAMLIAGLGTEAVIFFFSAFEPPHAQPDWSLVYPELAGLSEEDAEALGEDPKLAQKKSALEKFDAMIENAEISPELFEKLGHGLRNLNDTTQKLADVSDATVATNNYVANFEKASEKVNQFADSYGQSATKLNQTADALSETYVKSSETVSISATKFAEAVSGSGSNAAEIITGSATKMA
ncbi:MAG: gliding motility protein GldL, partial [Bacteroidetes bacterium]|nr:gliding motility protein GldL [Bacteroidota bacterium]